MNCIFGNARMKGTVTKYQTAFKVPLFDGFAISYYIAIHYHYKLVFKAPLFIFYRGATFRSDYCVERSGEK